ncbi:hypothetical protein ACFE04_016418 [Oxalis oulophora]
MGGCCCSTRKPPHINATPCSPALEGRQPLAPQNGSASALTARLLVDLNLETSTPDTFRAPPAPLPYDLVLGCPQSTTDSESVQETASGRSFETLATCEDPDESETKPQLGPTPLSPKKIEILKDTAIIVEEEDCCPICLEEYDPENPKLLTECEHHFHLSCILEWMERSDICPICDKEVTFDQSLNQ